MLELDEMAARYASYADLAQIVRERFRDRKRRCASYSPHRLHRIAMAAVVGGLVAAGETVVEDADNVATSYPGFAKAMASLGAVVSADS